MRVRELRNLNLFLLDKPRKITCKLGYLRSVSLCIILIIHTRSASTHQSLNYQNHYNLKFSFDLSDWPRSNVPKLMPWKWVTLTSFRKQSVNYFFLYFFTLWNVTLSVFMNIKYCSLKTKAKTRKQKRTKHQEIKRKGSACKN